MDGDVMKPQMLDLHDEKNSVQTRKISHARTFAQINFDVPGKVQAWQRAGDRIVTAKSGRQFVSHYTQKKTRDYEEYVGWRAKKQMRGQSLTHEPVQLMFNAYIVVPKSWPKWKRELALSGRIEPTCKPDLDNIEKAIKDGLTGIVWHDDSQVVSGQKNKFYAEEAKLTVAVKVTGGYPSSITKNPANAATSTQ